MNEINTVADLVRYAALEGQTLSPVILREGWLIIDTPQGQFWFWDDNTVMQVL